VILTHDAFLSDIVENAGDDAPRLIYADWLDDEGDADRAELIRLQCRLARLPDDHPERSRLKARESDLLLHHESTWRAALPELEAVTWEDFSRGFVEAVFVQSAEAFLQQAPALFAAAPIRRVRLARIDPPSGRALARSPYLARLTELNLGSNTGVCDQCVHALARSPHVANLTALLLHYNPLDNNTIADLADSRHLGQLRELYLSGTGLDDSGVAALAGDGRMPHLTDLDLRDNQVGDGGARALAFNVGLAELSTLYLVNNRIGENGAEALAWTERLPSLRCLYINYNPIGNAGALAFATSPYLGGLRELDLRHCDIRDAGGRALAGAVALDGLRLLWLSGNRMRMETLTLLRRRFGDRLQI
jgi:uncharacterized protein (TIGR02996 family)